MGSGRLCKRIGDWMKEKKEKMKKKRRETDDDVVTNGSLHVTIQGSAREVAAIPSTMRILYKEQNINPDFSHIMKSDEHTRNIMELITIKTRKKLPSVKFIVGISSLNFHHHI